MPKLLISGMPSISRPRSSVCVAARVSSLSWSGAASLQAWVSRASRSSWERPAMLKSRATAVRWNSGMVKAAPARPGQRFMPSISSRTSSKYFDPFSRAPHSSWASLVAISTFFKVFSKVSISERTPTSSCWACRITLMRSAWSWCIGGRVVSSSASTAFSQESSSHAREELSYNFSMLMNDFRQACSSRARSCSHFFSPKVTVSSNLCSLTSSPVGVKSSGSSGSWRFS
mmetsp:Transcript_98042/g.261772  ORF Transcript_98042/g.261772 Transcript_98042/m.261772 type:complete len:230 (-) Transcript_98042:358-1047(-)